MSTTVSSTTTVPPTPRSTTLKAVDPTVESEQAPLDAPKNDHDLFFWTYTEEPHRSRRQAIIKAHPEVCQAHLNSASKLANCFSQVLKLCGPEPLTIPLVVAVVSLQILCAYLLRNTPILSWTFFLTAYVIGATSNQNLFLAIHEISHNLAFKSPLANRVLAVYANLPIGIPYSASFRVSQERNWASNRSTTD